MNTLKILRSATKKLAEYFALKPTATMMHAPSPTIETSTRAKDQLPWKMKPIKRKMSRIRPASWKLGRSARGSPCALQVRVSLLLPPVSLAHARQARKELLLVGERVGEDHKQSANDREVAQEEGEVEEESVAEA